MTSLRTFAHDVRPYPARRDDWEGCARLAQSLLAQRAERYPALVEQSRLTQIDADRGLRVMGAIAALWDRVIDRAPFPDPADCAETLGASLPEMQAEIATARQRLRQIAERNPDNRDVLADAAHGDALWWHLQPVADGALPHIWIAHDHALWERQGHQRASAA